MQNVTTDLQIKSPQVNVKIDRDKAQVVGVSPQQIENALFTAYGQRQISTIYAPNNEYWVIMELEPQYQLDPQMLSYLYVRSSNGQLVPLNSVASLTTSLGPLTVNHMGQLPSVTISFDLLPGVSLGQGVDEIQNLASKTLPLTINTSFQGTAQAFQQSLTGIRHAAGDGDSCDLYRVGGFVRELYSSADDSFGIAGGSVWSAADAAGVWYADWILFGFVGNHHADRNCEEKRDHDGGLRDGIGARRKLRRQRRRRCRDA